MSHKLARMSGNLDIEIDRLTPKVEGFPGESSQIPSVSGHGQDIIADSERSFNDPIRWETTGFCWLQTAHNEPCAWSRLVQAD